MLAVKKAQITMPAVVAKPLREGRRWAGRAPGAAGLHAEELTLRAKRATLVSRQQGAKAGGRREANLRVGAQPANRVEVAERNVLPATRARTQAAIRTVAD